MLIAADELGKQLRHRRRQIGWTQQQLAERAGVARQWIVRLERGNERAELAPILRTIFQLDLNLQLEPIDPSDELEDYVKSFARGHS